jgi:trk system potassium uptake protein
MSQIAVIGLGRFGSAVALELVRLGHKVIGIDSRERLVDAVADELAHAVIADATDESALAELDLKNYDTVVVAIGESLEASLLCVLNCKNLGVKEIWVKATSKSHHAILSRLGVSRIIHPEEEMGIRVAQSLNYPMVNQYMYIGHHTFVIELTIPEKLEGKTIDEILGSTEQVKPIVLKRKSEVISTTNKLTEKLQRKDTLLLLGRLEDLESIAPQFEE